MTSYTFHLCLHVCIPSRGNHIHQFKTPCWQPIHIFHCLISCLHQCFTNIDFSSQFSNKRHFYSLRLFARLSSFCFHDCKRENLVLQSHIRIIVWTVVILLIDMPFALTSHLSFYNWQDSLSSTHASYLWYDLASLSV